MAGTSVDGWHLNSGFCSLTIAHSASLGVNGALPRSSDDVSCRVSPEPYRVGSPWRRNPASTAIPFAAWIVDGSLRMYHDDAVFFSTLYRRFLLLSLQWERRTCGDRIFAHDEGVSKKRFAACRHARARNNFDRSWTTTTVGTCSWPNVSAAWRKRKP